MTEPNEAQIMDKQIYDSYYKPMTQCERLLKAFKDSPDHILSMGYIERELYMSQGNARLKELKDRGFEFEDAGLDDYGFKLHKLIGEPYELPDDFEASKKVISSQGNHQMRIEI